MGLLDDAIREHLELKRQRGADPSEVERQENEALGATQRAEFALAEEPASEEPVAEVSEPVDAGEEREPFDVEALEPADELAEPEPAAADADPWLDEARDEVPADESLDHPLQAPAEDVLEETPDFLQETPEHDRLWFEQRPPRDFDWDK
jgi:hypothetical protein